VMGRKAAGVGNPDAAAKIVDHMEALVGRLEGEAPRRKEK